MITALLFLFQMSCSSHDMQHRGDVAMGFSHAAATHHFRVYADGGAIEARANDAADSVTVDAIRAHLKMVEAAFASGDFTKPEFIHETMPDGAAEMKQLRSAIRYQYQEVPDGGRVRITTADPRALDAVQRFLRFQIREHATGDSLETQKSE